MNTKTSETVVGIALTILAPGGDEKTYEQTVSIRPTDAPARVTTMIEALFSSLRQTIAEKVSVR